MAAAADSLVWDGERFAAIGAGPAHSRSPAPDVVLCRILWRFAVRLLAAGHHHPWPWPLQSRPAHADALRDGRTARTTRTSWIWPASWTPSWAGPGEQAAPPTVTSSERRDRLTDQLTRPWPGSAGWRPSSPPGARAGPGARAAQDASRKATAYRRTLGYRLSRGCPARQGRPQGHAPAVRLKNRSSRAGPLRDRPFHNVVSTSVPAWTR